MGDQNPKPNFQFIVATVANPRAPDDKAVRSLIRKQAMKQASEARRSLGTYGKHNLRQYPVFSSGPSVQAIQDTESVREDAEQSGIVRSGHEEKNMTLETEPVRNIFKNQPTQDRPSSRSTIPPNMSPKDHQALLVSYNFDIFNLSSLASVYIGRYSGKALSADPSRLASLLRSKKWSYLTYLPSLYGRAPCLNDAIDCIITRVREILVSNGRIEQSMVIPSYLKALKSLQTALYNPKECLEPEVLGAIEVLALYELLNPSNIAAWIRHAAGAARVIQLRGPRKFETEFEKALLMAYANPVMTESLLSSRRCFLESGPWRDLFLSLIIEDSGFSDRGKISITLHILKSRVPGIFSDIVSVTCNRNTTEELAFKKTALGVRQLREELLHWFHIYGPAITLAPGQPTSSLECDQQSEIRSTYLSCIMMVARLLAVLSTQERTSLEDEALEYANEAIQLERDIKHLSHHALLYLGQTLALASSIRSTTSDWRDENELEGVGSTIDRGKFERWTSMFGCRPL